MSTPPLSQPPKSPATAAAAVVQGPFARLKHNVLGLQPSQRVGLLAVGLLVFGGLIWIVLGASAPVYRPLFSGISEAQSAQVVEALEAQHIPYELGAGGAISVPQEHLYQARIKLAGQGMPEFEGMGFELFDKNEFGMTAFTQKVNYQRAMENELARTIRHIKHIKQARVHLVLPEKSLFKEDQRPPSASVILSLNSGGTLAPEHVRSIRHMVASAVEGLDARDIAIVDAQGKMLAKPRGEGAGGLGGDPSDQASMAAAMEADLEGRITELLAPLVGAGQVRSKVSIELDTRQIVETAESYDPQKTAIRREQRSEEESQKPEASAGGVAGAAAQLRGSGGAQEAGAGAQRSKLNEIIDYEINKNVRQTTSTGVRIKRLSVAVLLDDAKVAAAVPATPDQKADGATPGGGEAAAVAALDLGAIEGLVKSAVGFDPERGDQVRVVKQAFHPNPAALSEPLAFWKEPMFLSQAVRWGALTVIALLLLCFVARPLIRTLSAQAPQEQREEDRQLDRAVGRTVAELEAQLHQAGTGGGVLVGEAQEEQALATMSVAEDPVKLKQGALRAEVIELAHQDMDRASQVVSQWIRVS